MQGKVIKKLSNLFCVETPNGEFTFSCRKNLKSDGVFVGDNVEVDLNNMVIEKVLERKNLLIRPPLANLDKLIIVVSYEPEPDFMIVDKLILFCKVNGIEPVLCVNKIDVKEIALEAYKFLKIVKVSAKTGKGLEELKSVLKSNVSAFAGQSAVGKSALIKALVPNAKVDIGELSQKIKRGKNTTRHSELFMIMENSYLADTAGFTSLDEKLLNIAYYELASYYPDFLEYVSNCKYRSCEHISEKECGVRQAVRDGKLDKARYIRYKTIELVLKEEWRKTHG